MNDGLRPVQWEILRALTELGATYAAPASSEEIGQRLNLNPSYVRRQVRELISMNLAAVRRGNGGGYYLVKGEWRNEVVR